MSNRIYLEATHFRDEKTNTTTYGFRLFDDYKQAHCNLFDYSNLFDFVPENDFDLLKEACKQDQEDVVEILDFARENQKGICINYEWYDYEQIAEILN